ncbi:KpsF/GutQ family sugar-phosphate isomerase [Natronohydrobacter thiooxidans]|uniref:KpsF/GutQ family sugar-phosphate isomerase n=1 Tax=Natronohydrobacter thiooxidans TaxID=87172 RepID=UPI001FE3DB42|nr:KpsF/GutQ family sugar-phosphate isomerase [Natronohydrobacter thiooxidans]
MTDLEAIGYGQDVLRAEAGALEVLADRLDGDFARAVDLILTTKGRLIVAGIGKSGHVGRKIAATFASTGTPAHFVHAAEASHGDLGMITPDDICLLLSRSGETQELGDLISYTRRFGVTLISISANAESTLARASDMALILPDVPEVCAIGMAPTTSTTMSMALGDALAVAVMRAKGFDPARFHQFHPGGKLGAQFLRVKEVMVTGDALPLVAEDTAMPEVLMRMTGSGYGVAILTEGGALRGIVTDGDLRRHMDGLMTRRAGDVATRAPKSIAGEALVSEAVQVMNTMKVTALCVVEGDRLTGLIRLHDCLRAGVI